MNFKPMSKAELKNILPEGSYIFKVISAVEKQSSAGNQMIELNLRVDDDNNQIVFIKDWLLKPQEHEEAEKTKNKIWKIRSFCFSIGLQEKYESGSLSETDCLNKTGMAKVKIKQDQNGDPVNAISYYMENIPSLNSGALTSKAKEKEDVAMKTHKDSFIDDDLPF